MFNTLINGICEGLESIIKGEDNTPRKTYMNSSSKEYEEYLINRREEFLEELKNRKPVKIKTGETVIKYKDGTTSTRTRYKYVR